MYELRCIFAKIFVNKIKLKAAENNNYFLIRAILQNFSQSFNLVGYANEGVFDHFIDCLYGDLRALHHL